MLSNEKDRSGGADHVGIDMIIKNPNRMVVSNTCTLLFITINLCLVFVSCHKDNPVAALDNQFTFSGTVTDSSGVAIESVAVHFITRFDHPFPKYRYPIINPTTQIGFAIPSHSFVTVRVYRYGTDELISTIVNDSMEAGYHNIGIDQKGITNGLYYYVIYVDQKLLGRWNMMNYVNNIPDLIQASPVAYTDRNGQFKLPQSVFGAGVKLHVTRDAPKIIDTITITTSIELILYRQGYRTLRQDVILDTTRNYNGSFKLIR